MTSPDGPGQPAIGSPSNGLHRAAMTLLRWLRLVEDSILVSLLLAMILMAVAQIGLRNFAGGGFSWADPFLRVVVLWTALLGAMVASRDDSHISIDIIARLLKPRAKILLNRISRLATSGIAFAMAWFSGRFVLDEYEFGLTAFANVPAWVAELVMPVAFVVIGTRYLLLALFATPDDEPDEASAEPKAGPSAVETDPPVSSQR